MKKICIVLVAFVIAAVPAAFATSLTVSNVVVTVSDINNLTVQTSSDLPFVFNGVGTQTFDAFDVSTSNPDWWKSGTADLSAQFSFSPQATSNPIVGDISGSFSGGNITWANGGTTTFTDSDGIEYTLTLEATNYGWCNDDVEGTIKQDASPVPEPASLMMLGSGLLGLAGIARRRFMR